MIEMIWGWVNDDRIYIFCVNYPFNIFIIIIIIFLWNHTLNKKLNLPAGGGKCLWVIHSKADSFRKEVNSSLYEYAGY